MIDTNDNIQEVGAHTYRFRKMDAFTQLHVARRLAPLLAGLGKFSELSLDSAFGPIAQALAKVSDEDINYILHRCLAATDRKLPAGGWMPVWNKQANTSQFADLALPDLMSITAKSLEANLSSFLGGAASNILAPPQE